MDIVLFTDGSCLNNGKPSARAGYGIYFPNKEFENISKKFIIPPITNQRAELYAIFEGLETIFNKESEKNQPTKVTIYTDSKYSINCLTNWIENWKKNGWVSKTKNPIKNLDIIKPIYDILVEHKNVSFQHVKAHQSGSDELTVGNNIADQLAKDGIYNKSTVKNNVCVGDVFEQFANWEKSIKNTVFDDNFFDKLKIYKKKDMIVNFGSTNCDKNICDFFSKSR